MTIVTTKRRKGGFYGSTIQTFLQLGQVVTIENHSTFQWDDLFTGQQNPSWKAAVQRGLPASTPANWQKVTVDYSRGHCVSIVKTKTAQQYIQYHRVRGIIGQQPSSVAFPAVIDYSSAVSRAIAQFVSKAKRAQRSLESGIVGGERHETLKMVRTRGNQLALGVGNYLNAVLSRIHVARPHKLKILADLYLEYSWGWRQLFSDISAGYHALTRENKFELQAISATGRETLSFTDSMPTSGLGPFQWENRYLRRGTISVRYEGAVKVSINNDLPHYQSEFGLQLRDFVPTLWELLPYSFFVDYFTNIGDMIDVASFNKASLAWVNYTERYDQLEYYVPINLRYLAGYNPSTMYVVERNLQPSNITVKATKGRRQDSSDIPLPDFRFQIPGFGDRPQTWVNIAALMASKTLTWRKYL